MDEPKRNTYTQDPNRIEEMARLDRQSGWIELGMGGVLSEYQNRLPQEFRRVLDLACATGRWARKIAQLSPTVQVVGIDISQVMIPWASEMAQGLPNVEFLQGDILEPLSFPDNSFDIVNASLLFSVILRDSWEPFLRECMRVIRPGGVVRLTEANNLGLSPNSPNLTQLSQWMMAVHNTKGYGFAEPDNTSSLNMTNGLQELLLKQGFQEIQQFDYRYDYSAGQPLWRYLYDNAQALYRGWRLAGHLDTVGEAEWNRVYNAALREMQSSTFIGYWNLFIVTARRPKI